MPGNIALPSLSLPETMRLICILAAAALPTLWFGFSQRQTSEFGEEKPCKHFPANPETRPFFTPALCVQGLASQRSSSPQVFSAPSNVPRPELEITLGQMHQTIVNWSVTEPEEVARGEGMTMCNRRSN
jgi:hypothetical protein